MKLSKLPFATHKGMRLTVISISSFMAHTMRQEIEITGTQDEKVTFKLRGKRKEFYFQPEHDNIILNGWDLPIKVDSDSSAGFAGNACYNLVAESPEALKAILAESLLPLDDTTKAKIFFISNEQFKNRDIHNGALLHPDIETSHAVINRYKEKHQLI